MSPVTDQQRARRAGIAAFCLGLLCFAGGLSSLIVNGVNGLNSMNVTLGALDMVVCGVIIFNAGHR
ncbi:hypothetical protein AB0C84_21060 [Actinomadura sp. NPDC048955]|uniref:ABC-type proline/glycine betaine transport system permease subunit n=1 Tax=Actinomadura luteofluorescens TaxID=46163 RepID=A0A7Y9EK51_9ACTN|nr:MULTISPECIES: hypothetical protein [Actinomadura]MCR3743579.1 hypothetical protein [Actinomadura glauciflava]NYD49036.1 ABC-type proline/glycine betaine transport system permease subunit [Actinomadura luteofluorescens]